MEPLKPAETQEIIAGALADPAEVAEYEELLAEMFTVDPDAPPADPEIATEMSSKQQRLDELAAKLFPGGIKQH